MVGTITHFSLWSGQIHKPPTTEGFFRGFFQRPSFTQQVGIDISLLENGAFYKSFSLLLPGGKRSAFLPPSLSLFVCVDVHITPSVPAVTCHLYLFWKINQLCVEPLDIRIWYISDCFDVLLSMNFAVWFAPFTSWFSFVFVRFPLLKVDGYTRV